MKIASILLVLPALAWCQSAAPHRMEISVERREAAAWRPVDPNLVFSQGDRLRFRFRANFDGYLYVMNQATSGDYSLLFPREDTGSTNRVEGGKEYTVPATQGAFRVTGPPGQDILYWMVTPVALGNGQPAYVPLPPPPKAPKLPDTLHPRCDDTILKARGDCVDTSAGPRAVKPDEALPENLRNIPGAASRELLFIRDQKRAVVSSPGPLIGPVIYEFRLSHR